MSSPCSRIPLEILQKIFLHVLSSEIPILPVPILPDADPESWVTPPPSNSLILPRAPSTLSSVCADWRSCAYGMPDMWNELLVKVPKSMKNGDETEVTEAEVLELVKARLALAQTMPLKICLVAERSVRFGRSAIRAIIPFSHQWESIQLYTPPEVLTELIAPDPSLTYPGLEELQIRTHFSETWTITSILERCSQLNTLGLSGYGATAPSPPDFHPVTLTKLQTLIVEHPTRREPLIESLVLPNLKSLFLGGRSTLHPEGTLSILNAITRLKQRSKVDSFERLWIYFEMHRMDSPMLVDFLGQNHALRELRIDDSSISADLLSPFFFAALVTRNGDGNLLCSNLESLHLTTYHSAILDIPELGAFLEMRCMGQLEPNEKDASKCCSLTPAVHFSISIKPMRNNPFPVVPDVVKQWQEKGYLVNVKIVD